MFWIGWKIRCKCCPSSDTLKAISRANILTRPSLPSGSFTITSLVHLLPSSLLTRYCNVSPPVPFRFGARWARLTLLISSCPSRLSPRSLDFVMTIGFLNLWMDDRPFSLDHLHQLPMYVSKDTYQTVCDDKSGYDHILLAPSSRTYFGFEWNGWYFTSNTIQFGWKLSAFVYHSTGLLVSHYFRSIHIPCSLYIDDHHSSQIRLPRDSNLVKFLDPDKLNLVSAHIASFLVCYTLIKLGYCIGLQKSILQPSRSVPFLGFECDSRLQAFRLLPDKKQKFISLVEGILDSSHVSITVLQRLAGKCVSMAMAVPGARLFTNEINLAISRASRSSRPLPLSVPLRREIEHWLFLKSWSGFLPWRLERHHQFVMFSDASSYRWAGVLNPSAVPLYASDY